MRGLTVLKSFSKDSRDKLKAANKAGLEASPISPSVDTIPAIKEKEKKHRRLSKVLHLGHRKSKTNKDLRISIDGQSDLKSAGSLPTSSTTLDSASRTSSEGKWAEQIRRLSGEEQSPGRKSELRESYSDGDTTLAASPNINDKSIPYQFPDTKHNVEVDDIDSYPAYLRRRRSSIYTISTAETNVNKWDGTHDDPADSVPIAAEPNTLFRKGTAGSWSGVLDSEPILPMYRFGFDTGSLDRLSHRSDSFSIASSRKSLEHTEIRASTPVSPSALDKLTALMGSLENDQDFSRGDSQDSLHPLDAIYQSVIPANSESAPDQSIHSTTISHEKPHLSSPDTYHYELDFRRKDLFDKGPAAEEGSAAATYHDTLLLFEKHFVNFFASTSKVN
ncbi:hypothetical protein DFS34DRAFT_686976 [Phlyctochytrium arcticum]|nr:hypothetical protein DFS34DRAFT_686976 [Phlyctochytrium arcticum]